MIVRGMEPPHFIYLSSGDGRMGCFHLLCPIYFFFYFFLIVGIGLDFSFIQWVCSTAVLYLASGALLNACSAFGHSPSFHF